MMMLIIIIGNLHVFEKKTLILEDHIGMYFIEYLYYASFLNVLQCTLNVQLSSLNIWFL